MKERDEKVKLTFQSGRMGKPSVIDDNSIFIGGLAKKTFPLSSVTGIRKTPSTLKKLAGFLWITFKGAGEYAIGYTPQEQEMAEQGYELILAHLKTAEEQAAPKDEDLDEELDIPEEKEIRKRCKVCGTIFCYTLDDVRKSEKAKASAGLSSLGAAISAIGGTRMDMYGQEARANAYLSKVVDYSRCPSCHSTDLERLPNEPNNVAQEAPVPHKADRASAVEELKGLKELLDCGIITQEEFDAKKKQLLGL